MSFERYNFKDLFILDMANNHQGSIDHGKAIIDKSSELIKKYEVRAAIKFQFRDLPDFISSVQLKTKANKHVPRFLETKLEWDEFMELKTYADSKGMLTICTPFDERSVEKIVEMEFDIIKVASCSANDWPLLTKIVTSNKPVICSTGGLRLDEIDQLVSFFCHHAVDFSLMHCVSIYPTPQNECNLLDIKVIKDRYKDYVVGWSTHEDQDEILPVAIAKALGAEMFERHIGLETQTIKLNQYSSDPKQLEIWFKNYKKAVEFMGTPGRSNISGVEKEALKSLKRGVFLKQDCKKGKVLNEGDIYFAFPLEKGQLSSGEFKYGSKINKDLKADTILKFEDMELTVSDKERATKILKHAVYDIKALLNKANVTLNHMFKTEYSHHKGIKNFRSTGTVLIEVLNRDYAKKILVQLPNQSHPLHMHKLKEESFLVLYGDLELELDGKSHFLSPGEVITVLPGIWHQFKSKNGCVFEEISTTAYSSDSYYKDAEIADLQPHQRKTLVDHWGRFQIQEQII